MSVDVVTVTGSPATSGKTVAQLITAAPALTVEITNHTGSTDNVGVGDLTFSAQTSVADATRTEVQGDTDLFVRVFSWQQVGSDQHLICMHYLDFWLDQAGVVIGVEWTPVLSQHWWVDDPFGTAQTKQERNYDCAMKSGSTTIETFTGLNHAYQCQWAGLRSANDDQHARKHWVVGSIPTLSVTYGQDTLRAMMRAGYLPPLDLGTVYTGDLYSNPNSGTSGGFTNTYVPLGRQGHKEAINGTGGYVGRGVVTDADAKAISRQTSAAWRIARVMAQASLSVYHHWKDHRLAGGRVSIGAFPQKVVPLGPQSYPGLASEIIAVKGTGSELPDDVPNNAVNASNNQGAFKSWDPAHHTVYGYAMAFLDGERYLADAVLDQFSYTLQDASFDGFFYNPKQLFSEKSARATASGVDVTTTYGTTYMSGNNQERSFGWSRLSFDHAYALLADNDRHKPWFDKLEENTDKWLVDSFPHFPQSQDDFGTVWFRNHPLISSFMNGLTLQCFSRGCLLMENPPGLKEFRDRLARFFSDTALHNIQTIGLQDHQVVTDANSVVYLSRTERYSSPGSIVPVDNSDPTKSLLVIRHRRNIPVKEGDKFRFVSATSTTYPVEFQDPGQDFFVRNPVPGSSADRTNCNFSSTPNGPLLVATPQSGSNVRIVSNGSDNNLSPIDAQGANIPGDDDFIWIALGSLEYSYGAGSANVPQAVIDRVRTWAAPKTFTNFATWNLDGDLIR